MAVFVTVTVLGLRQERRQVLGALLGGLCPLGLASDSRGHRSYLLLRAPREPLYSFGGQRYGRPRGDQSVRRFRGSGGCQPDRDPRDHSHVRLGVLVSFIQAYVFTILTCVYLKDALHPSH